MIKNFFKYVFYGFSVAAGCALFNKVADIHSDPVKKAEAKKRLEKIKKGFTD